MWRFGLIMTALVVMAGARSFAQGDDAGLYRLSPGDSIEISFVQNPELNVQTRIRPDGRISMPLVGEVLVAGMTVTEVSARLSIAYGDILRSPSATIQVREYANRRIFVGGEVTRPGVMPLTGRQTALGAVMEAGGFRASAARDELLVVRRGTEDRPRILRLSLKDDKTLGSEASSFSLEPLDVVLVGESGIARTGRALDQYVRQMIPVNLGASWLFGSTVFGGR
jgi:polysaccharide export outer membrane protein